MFRIRQMHSGRASQKPPPADADKLIRAQSVRGAVLAALAVAAMLNFAWVWLAGVSGKFFPWFSVLQGAAIGLAVQRRGHGLDWRFPAVGAVLAIAAAFSGGFFVALATTVDELEAGSIRVLSGITWRTWQIYFDEVVNPVDYIYAFAAAAIAAFNARPRLRRHEVYALRMKQLDKDDE